MHKGVQESMLDNFKKSASTTEIFSVPALYYIKMYLCDKSISRYRTHQRQHLLQGLGQDGDLRGDVGTTYYRQDEIAQR